MNNSKLYFTDIILLNSNKIAHAFINLLVHHISICLLIMLTFNRKMIFIVFYRKKKRISAITHMNPRGNIILFVTMILILKSGIENTINCYIHHICPHHHHILHSYLVACQNYDQNCDAWAYMGECQRNPSYMLVSCARACGRCSRK